MSKPGAASSASQSSVNPTKKTRVRAIYSYNASYEDELSFQEGDLIDVTGKNTVDAGWWQGNIAGKGKSGLFPANYVEEIDETHQPSAAQKNFAYPPYASNTGGATHLGDPLIHSGSSKNSCAKICETYCTIA